MTWRSAGACRECITRTATARRAAASPTPSRASGSGTRGERGRRGARRISLPRTTPSGNPVVALLRDQLPDLGHQIVGYVHDGFGRFNANFLLYKCLVFGLFSVVGKDPLH